MKSLHKQLNQLRQNVTKLIIYTPIRCYTVIAKVYIFQEKMYSCDFKNHFQYDQLSNESTYTES